MDYGLGPAMRGYMLCAGDEKTEPYQCSSPTSSIQPLLVSLFPVSNKIFWEMFGFARAIKSEV